MGDVNVASVKFGNPPSWSVANETDQFLVPNSGLTKLYVQNDSDDYVTVTVKETRNCNFGHTNVDFVQQVPGNGTRTELGTFRRDRYNRPDGKLEVTFAIPGAGNVNVAGVYEVREDGRY